MPGVTDALVGSMGSTAAQQGVKAGVDAGVKAGTQTAFKDSIVGGLLNNGLKQGSSALMEGLLKEKQPEKKTTSKGGVGVLGNQQDPDLLQLGGSNAGTVMQAMRGQ
jgi:hypothetical protein